jgi:hypothetical protein
MMSFLKNAFAALVVLGLLALPRPVLACAACFGASDSSMAKGMNMGIFALLGVIVLVLGGIASFFIFLARRASTHGTSAKQFSGLSKQIS